MYTEQMTQALALGAPIFAKQLTGNATLNTGPIDMQASRRALFQFQTGTFGGTSPTLSAVLQIQESPDSITWSDNAIIPSYTLTASQSQATLEIRDEQVGTGMRYVRLQAVCTVSGTSPTIPVSGLPLGGEGIHKPNNVNNDFSVISQTVVN